jgi:hypothetical protein
LPPELPPDGLPQARKGRYGPAFVALAGGAFSCPRHSTGVTVPSVIDDLNILRATNILVKHDGADAAIEAARRADELLAAGDTDGSAIWKRILAAVAEFTRTTPAEGERVN